MKPRRWLAYTVSLNDLLATYPTILDRFEESDVPLDEVFGSNTEPGAKVPGLIISIGLAVEPPRLAEIVGLLEGLGQLFIAIDTECTPHSKCIYVGALNLRNEPVRAVSGRLLETILTPGLTASSLVDAIEREPSVEVLPGRSSV